MLTNPRKPLPMWSLCAETNSAAVSLYATRIAMSLQSRTDSFQNRWQDRERIFRIRQKKGLGRYLPRSGPLGAALREFLRGGNRREVAAGEHVFE